MVFHSCEQVQGVLMRTSRFMFHHNTSVFPCSIMIFVIVVQHVQPRSVYLTVPVQRYHKEKSSKADVEENGSQDEMLLYTNQKEQLQRVSMC